MWQDVGTLAGHTVDELREISLNEGVYTMVYIHMSEATQCVQCFEGWPWSYSDCLVGGL